MTTAWLDDPSVVQRIFDHIDHQTTDLSEEVWREPVANYRSEERLATELSRVFRRQPTPFCPSAALSGAGSYLARRAAGTPILAVRGNDGRVRAFRNACRHRGTQLADGEGCAKAFVCRYHGWTYGLDGALRHVPHEYGFPGLDKSARGLVPLPAFELGGIVFVTQEGPPLEMNLDIPTLIPPSHRVLDAVERDMEANWKVIVEGFLEGYHIRTTHPGTFYPVQFDNLNVVEKLGRGSRITFPYRAINKLRAVEPSQRSADGKLTYVYHFFPNVILATFPGMMILVVLEPLAIDRTRFFTYRMTDRAESEGDMRAALERGSSLVDAGAAEDRDVTLGVQRGLASGANEFLEFGRCEGAIGHFHRSLHALID